VKSKRIICKQYTKQQTPGGKQRASPYAVKPGQHQNDHPELAVLDQLGNSPVTGKPEKTTRKNSALMKDVKENRQQIGQAEQADQQTRPTIQKSVRYCHTKKNFACKANLS
jgi:hypothetical protein